MPSSLFPPGSFSAPFSPRERLALALEKALDLRRNALNEEISPSLRADDARPPSPDLAFFDHWFTLKYYFLFKKNLTVTNIQFAELFALMREHIHSAARAERDTAGRPHLHLLTRQDYRLFIENVLHDVERSPDTGAALDLAISTFREVFDRTILIAPFFGSCAVFLPGHLDLDLPLICSESGYIHSCGRLVYLRNVEKVRKARFLTRLESYLDTHYVDGRKAALIPYSHEAFSDYDEHERDMLRNGLDDVKLYVTKYFIGTYPLVDVLEELRVDLADRLLDTVCWSLHRASYARGAKESGR
jgi:hypothetical protein